MNGYEIKEYGKEYAVVDVFRGCIIISQHRTLAAALDTKRRRNQMLIAQGLSPIYGVVDSQGNHAP